MSAAGSTSPAQAAAVAAAVGLGILCLFQLALALGAPLGRAAYGGSHPGVLPVGLRVTSAAAILVWTLAALVVLRRSGFADLPVPPAVAGWGTWVVVGLLLVGVVMNLASSSPWERYLLAPYALALAGLCFLATRTGAT